MDITDRILWGNFYGGLMSMAIHPGMRRQEICEECLDYYALIADQMLERYQARRKTWDSPNDDDDAHDSSGAEDTGKQRDKSPPAPSRQPPESKVTT